MNVLNSRSREFRKVKKKRDNLKDLIFYETLSIELDSIINLIKMSDANRIAFFNDYINKISEKNNKQKNKNENLGSLTSSISTKDSESILFYFYNSNAVAFGKNEFKNRWGNRKLQDDWRWSAYNYSSNDKNNKKKYNDLNKDSILSTDYYISLIPKDPKVIDSLNNTRNDTYFRLGAIYKDQFEEYEISNFNFFALLDNKPVEDLVAPTKYFIYKNLLSLDSIYRAETFKEEIIQNHRSSKYAEILLNPNLVLEQKQNSNEIYEKIYVDFSNQDFLDVIEKCDKSILEFSGEPIVAKFEFLKSLAIAKVYGFKEYEKALNYIKLNYSSTAEGKEAELILDEVLPVVKNDKFVNNNLSENYKIIYQFDRESNELILSELKKIEKYIDNVDYLDLRASKDFYNNIITFVVVHGLKSYDGGLGLAERLENSIDIQANSFSVISSENYKTIQIHKNLDKFENK